MTQTKYTAPKTLPKKIMHSGEERTFAKDGGVCLRVVPGRGKYVSGAKHNVPVLVELHSGEKIQEKGTEKEERKPLHLCLVLDKSGSMSGKKLAFAKEACEYVVKNLKSSDRCDMVAYDTNVTVVHHSKGDLGAERESLLRKISQIQSGSCTNICDAMTTASKLFNTSSVLEKISPRKKLENFVSYITGSEEKKNETTVTEGGEFEGTKRIMLFSDGLANAGKITNTAGLCQLAASLRLENKISTTCFGIGDDFNEETLAGMSESGGGGFYYIKESEQIPNFVAVELEGLCTLVGTDAVLSLHGLNGAMATKAYGYDTPSEIRVGDLREDGRTSFVFNVEFPAKEEHINEGSDGTYKATEIISATLRYTPVDSKNEGKSDGEVTVKAIARTIIVGEEGKAEKEDCADVAKALGVAKASEMDKEVMQMIDEGNMERAEKLAEAKLCALETLNHTYGKEDERLGQMWNQQQAQVNKFKSKTRSRKTAKKEVYYDHYAQKSASSHYTKANALNMI